MDEFEKIKLVARVGLNIGLLGTLVPFCTAAYFTFKGVSWSRDFFMYAGIALPALLYYNYKAWKAVFNMQERRKERSAEIAEEQKFMTEFLQDDFSHTSLEKLQELVKSLQFRVFPREVMREYGKRYVKHVQLAEQRIEELKHEQTVHVLHEKKEQLQEDLEQLSRIKEEETQSEEERK
jgi:hypothetical protein